MIPFFLLFYVRGMLHPNQKLRWLDFGHLLFPLIVTIGIMPDLILSDDEKVHILMNFYQKVDYLLLRQIGFFPPSTLQPGSMVIVVAYGLYTFSVIRSAERKKGATFVYVNKHILVWLKLLTGVVVLYFIIEVIAFWNLNFKHEFDSYTQVIKCLFGIILFTYFMCSPNLQENMDGCIQTNGKTSESLIKAVDNIFPNLLPIHQEDHQAIQFSILWKESKCFLKDDCDLAYMSSELDISPTKFSSLLKKYYGMSFSEFMNRLKIHHFLTEFDHFGPYTLETYIYQSGFSNRSTFYAAFKKYVGVNPSFYLKGMKEVG